MTEPTKQHERKEVVLAKPLVAAGRKLKPGDKVKLRADQIKSLGAAHFKQ